MKPRAEVPAPLNRLAHAQAGVLTREQCLAFGLTPRVVRRLIGSGLWQRLTDGVYLTHNGPRGWRSLAWAGVLIGGDDAVLAGDAAGYLWGLLPEPPAGILVAVPHDRTPAARLIWRFQRTRHPTRPAGSPPRTPGPETVIDLCLAHPGRRAEILADAVTIRKMAAGAILKAMDARPRLKDRQLLAAMLGRTREGIHSELEHLYARDVERAHGLPRGRRQVFDGRHRTDVRYDRVIIELDGRAGHEGSGVFRDMARDNAHTLRDERTLRYGWADCTQRPCAVARQVAALLMWAGWPGPITTCPRCRNTGIDLEL